MLSNLSGSVFTLINQFTADGTQKYTKHILKNCGKREGIYDKSSGQMFYKAGTWTAYIKDWEKYKPPAEYNGEENRYTVNVGDLLIFADIADVAPTDFKGFNALRDKYKNCGGIVTGVEVYINYKPDGTPWKTNHVEVIRA